MPSSESRPATSGPRLPEAGPRPQDPLPFWRRKKLAEMTPREWESLCDGCGRCCLNKLTDIDSGATVYTSVRCKLFDPQSCRCTDYANRRRKVRDCVQLTPRGVPRLKWLPPTCAYRLIAEGRDLYWWHHLKSGSRDTVHEAGVSVRGHDTVSEAGMPDEEYENHVVKWPGRVPKAARQRGAKE